MPRTLWPRLRDRLVDRTRALVLGDPSVAGTDLGAVITERQFRKHEAALLQARVEAEVLAGGSVHPARGWFVEPTLLHVDDPHSRFMTGELFAPILTAFVYEDADWDGVLRLVDESTRYGLTGAVCARDETALARADAALRYTAGNYAVNDKPTGRSSASNHSAAPAPQAPTTRSAPSGT